MWGMNASDAEAFKESPYTLVLTLKDGGMGVMAEYLTEGDDPFMLDLEWNKPVATTHPLGIDIEVTASLLAPNTLRMVTMAKEMMLTDVQTMTFTALGIQIILALFFDHLQIINREAENLSRKQARR